MSAPRRHPSPGFARRLLLVLMLLGFIAAPMLTLAGQTHAAMHDDAAHAHGSGQHGHDDSDHEDGLLHASMHASTCCGHVSALPPSWMAPAFAPVSTAPAMPACGEPPANAPDDLFRPPIA